MRRIPAGLGLRVRKARLELGLSLAQAAGNHFSRAFLNQVELGQARPSMRSLQVIAERLQKPVEYFLQDTELTAAALQLTLVESETRLYKGDINGAESLLTALLRRRIPLEVKTRAQLILAEAVMRRRAVEEGMSLLEEAVKAALRAGWKDLLVALYDRMGSGHYLRRRFQQASRWFDRALAEYDAAGLNDPILRARILGHQANIHYVSGATADAIAGYQLAISSAEHLLDMKALAGMYEGLAMALKQGGQLEPALTYAQRSLRLFETVNDVQMSAQLRNNMAEMLLQQGQAAEAERMYDAGAAQLERVGDREMRPHLLSGSAEAALEQGALDRAERRMKEAVDASNHSLDPIAQLVSDRVAGRVTHALGFPEESRAHFERALAIASGLKSAPLRGRVAYDYARVLEAQGDAVQAAARFREAYEAQAASTGA